MISHRLDLALPGGVEARVLFTSRGGAASGGSSRSPYAWANLGSHVGDDPAAVVANRHALAEALGVQARAMTFMHPDHGRGVATVSEPTGVAPGAEITSVDALVTTTAGIGLVALAADCVPVILVEPVTGVVAAVHSGWRGLALDVLGAAVGQMVAVGACAQDVQAILGPAICGSCYPVPAERVEEVARVRPEAVTTAPDGQPALDLRAGLAARLDELGATSTFIGGCTAEDRELYSHRRDGLTGRQGGAVAIVAAA
jgi:YfiH family protein